MVVCSKEAKQTQHASDIMYVNMYVYTVLLILNVRSLFGSLLGA